MIYRSFEEHLDPEIAPKRVLALDGGGLRGVLSLAFLKKIEDILRDRADNSSFRLCDHYDLIGGTSTGAIISAGLSLGMSVDEIRDHYFNLGGKIFKPGFFSSSYLSQKFDAAKVATALKDVFGDRTLGSGDFKTGVMIMSKRLDTGSPWPLTNNPKAVYFNEPPGKHTIPMKDYPLWSVVRASTAAPTYFEPESIAIQLPDAVTGQQQVEGEFVDGGMSPANNPALQLVLMATVKGYGFGWQMGEDRLAVTSIGTGRSNRQLGPSSGVASIAAVHAVKALRSVLEDCDDLVEVIMQWMSRSPTARRIDRDMESLEGSYAGVGPSLTYLRYNVHFEEDWFMNNLQMNIDPKLLEDLAKMDKPGNMAKLEEIGRHAAEIMVDPQHLSAP